MRAAAPSVSAVAIGIGSASRAVAARPAGRSPRSTAWRLAGLLVTYAILLALAVVFVVPLVWLLTASLRPTQELFRDVYPLTWHTFWPESFTLDGYFGLLNGSFTRALANSVVLAVCTAVGGVVVNSLAAYPFARLHFPGRDVLF